MAIGMTYEQYWYGDPMMVRAFYKANQIRKDIADEAAWLNGLYVYNALNAAIGSTFHRPGSAPADYPDQPFSLKKKQEEKQRKTEVEQEEEAVWAMAWMSSFVQAGKHWGKQHS